MGRLVHGSIGIQVKAGGLLYTRNRSDSVKHKVLLFLSIASALKIISKAILFKESI